MGTYLNKEQTLAVTSDAKTLVVVAGPGSGKSHTLIERIRRLLSDGVPPTAICSLTFTVAAGQELTHRLDGVRLGYVGTLHGFCLRLLQTHPALVGYPDGKVTVLDEEQAGAWVERIAKEHRYRGTKEVLEEALKAGPGLCREGQHLTPAELVAADFYNQLRMAGVVDYEGLLHWGLRILQGIPCGTWPYTHLFVDEVQDASPLDHRLYNTMPVDYRFLVGDDSQSIYGFRGAEPEYFIDLARAAAEDPEGELIKLETNYRSDKAICVAADRLIEHNQSRVPKCNHPASPDAGAVLVNPWRPATAAQEMARLAADLAEQPDPAQCAVLLRTNALVNQYAEFLAGMGLPIARRESRQAPADWRTARALLSLLCNPDNDAQALAYLELANPEGAQAMLLAALEQFSTLNATHWHLPSRVSLDAVPGWLARFGIGLESQGRVALAAQELDPAADVAELVVAITEAEAEAVTVGAGITVCTVHAAKGREWDCVYLPAFEQRIIPGPHQADEVAALEEERRLAFVAVTRARHRLVLSWCTERQSHWQRQPTPAQASQFVGEMAPGGTI